MSQQILATMICVMVSSVGGYRKGIEVLTAYGCAIASYHTDDLKEGVLLQGLRYLGGYTPINQSPDNAGHAWAGLSSEAAQILMLSLGQRNLSSVQILSIFVPLHIVTLLWHRGQTIFQKPHIPRIAACAPCRRWSALTYEQSRQDVRRVGE